MKYKKLIFVSIILIVIGLLASVTTLAANQFDFSELDQSIVSKTYDINSDFDNIDCDLEVSDLNIFLTTDTKNYALCLEKENIKFDVKVENNSLVIKENYENKMFSFGKTEVALYLNKNTIQSLNVTTDSGDICIIDNFNINNIKIEGKTNDVELMWLVANDINIQVTTGDVWANKVIANNMTVTTSTGDIEIDDCKISNDLSLKVSTGEIELSNAEIANTLTINVKSGDINLDHITCKNIQVTATTGEVELKDVIASMNMNIETSTGEVELHHCDANAIDIKTSTGDVVGSVTSNKVFDAQSGTGKVMVPNTKDGGTCKIRSSTGRISISIE